MWLGLILILVLLALAGGDTGSDSPTTELVRDNQATYLSGSLEFRILWFELCDFDVFEI